MQELLSLNKNSLKVKENRMETITLENYKQILGENKNDF